VKIPLHARLFASHAFVAAVGAGVAYLTVRLLAPHLFDERMGMMDTTGSAMMGGDDFADVQGAFASALDTALVVGVLAGVAAAAVVAAWVTRRVLRPLQAVRIATRQIAAGSYEQSVPLPVEPELAELAGDVNSLASALAKTESRRTRLLGEVAHEMRTPLTSLDGYVEGMIDGVFAADADTLTSLSAELRRLHRLADDLSSLSRTEEQGLVLDLEAADLAELVRRTATRLAPQFSDARVTLSVEETAALPVDVDPDRVTQVLTNLLGNALLATPAGGAVTVTMSRTADHGQVQVTDTGVGLAKSDLERVFERFYRAPGNTRRSDGSGIGLTIARGIARAHGGDITATSAGRGRGATFVLMLPLGTTRSSGREPY
jgi:histidine kinase